MNEHTGRVDPADAQQIAAPLVEVRDFVNDAPAPEFNPIEALGRLMRGRWLACVLFSALVGVSLGTVGFSVGTAVYEGKSIIRISAREPSILFADGDDSRLKLFQAFVKGETTYVASHPVMQRAAELVSADPAFAETEVVAKDVSGAVEIKRKDALIIISAKSADPAMAAAKANAVVDAYLALHAEGEQSRANYRERELAAREVELLGKLEQINATMLEVGGEFGTASLVKAHITKVAQLESLLSRRAEVNATLEAMRTQSSIGAADMGDVEIKRATLLDRGLADLTFDKAKREAELVNLLRRYREESPKVRQKQQEITVIDAAINARREQIAVLGRTGALTDAETSSEEETTAEIEALLQKVSEQIEAVRADAKSLNGKRIRLDFLQEEHEEIRRMLDETRRALDAIRLESRNALPGLIEVLTPAIVPEAPAKDKRKMFGIAGTVGGGFVAMALFMIVVGSRGRVRFSDDLWRLTAQIPLLRVIRSRAGRPEAPGDSRDYGHLCNAIQLLPDHTPSPEPGARIIAVGGADTADGGAVALALAESFANRAIRTLLIDADLVQGTLTETLGLGGQTGWREMLAGNLPSFGSEDPTQLSAVGTGTQANIFDETVSARSVRAVLSKPAREFGVIIVNVGSLGERLSSELVASASDLVIGVVQPGDTTVRAQRNLRRADELARKGAAIVFCEAGRRDPGIAV